MKQIYTLINLFFITLMAFSQGYNFGIVHNTGFNFSVVAIPDFDAVDTDISDIGFTLMLPAGNEDVTNLSQFNGRIWSATEATASQLLGLGLGDGTRDAFVLNLPPGQTILSHTAGQQITLVSFDVSNSPSTGFIELLPNSDPIAVGLGGATDSFYNSNIDNTTTQSYFSGFASGMENFNFQALGLVEVPNNWILKIYPNPVSDLLRISSSHRLKEVFIYNMIGKKVWDNATDLEYLDVSSLAMGLYLIKVVSEDNKQSVTKLIIE